MVEIAFIALGSNLGDRHRFLELALEEIDRLPHTSTIAATRAEETEPLGEIPQPRYLNQMIALRTELSPEDLLEHLLRIERVAGRTRGKRWESRTLDLDIVAFGNRSVRSDLLTLPHPGLADRDFWKRQMAELERGLPAPVLRTGAGDLELPRWARVSPDRAEHIVRVVDLLMTWSSAMELPAEERDAWRDAGLWHDSLRDAAEDELRRIVPWHPGPANILHGPAAAERLRLDGETREAVLEAIRDHTVGNAGWERTGRALYMADFLEPGRDFLNTEREALAAAVPWDFEDTFRRAVLLRTEWSESNRKDLAPQTIELRSAVS
jgi:2-amino-4-hydroxy-6-hydroxymethyldihydropteridine diphosphokinase